MDCWLEMRDQILPMKFGLDIKISAHVHLESQAAIESPLVLPLKLKQPAAIPKDTGAWGTELTLPSGSSLILKCLVSPDSLSHFWALWFHSAGHWRIPQVEKSSLTGVQEDREDLLAWKAFSYSSLSSSWSCTLPPNQSVFFFLPDPCHQYFLEHWVL